MAEFRKRCINFEESGSIVDKRHALDPPGYELAAARESVSRCSLPVVSIWRKLGSFPAYADRAHCPSWSSIRPAFVQAQLHLGVLLDAPIHLEHQNVFQMDILFTAMVHLINVKSTVSAGHVYSLHYVSNGDVCIAISLHLQDIPARHER